MKGKILRGFLAIVLIVLVFFIGMNSRLSGDPQVAYQVYLNGEKIGLIKSENELLELIDTEQAELKTEFGVDKIYPPSGLDIEKVYTYDTKINSAEHIYNEIKNVEPFTIQGYQATITYPEKKGENESVTVQKEKKVLYMMDKSYMKDALYDIVSVFIPEEELSEYESNTQEQIVDTGSIITSVYFDETITIKETLISTEEYIFNSKEDLSKYLLYGTLEEQKTYVVKEGDNLDKIADNHKLNIQELLIANPNYTSSDVLLAVGETLNVGLIDPVVSVVYHMIVVEDVDVNYKTVYVDDPTQFTDYQEKTQIGVNGVTRVTQNIKLINGEIQSLNIAQYEVIKAPVNEVYTRGTKIYGGGTWVYQPSTGEWGWPTISPFIITSGFGWRWGKSHRGIDISGTGKGSPIFSSTEGVVLEVFSGCPTDGWYGNSCGGGYGNYVKIQTPDGYIVDYAHLAKKINVVVGQKVGKSHIIGYMGNSGSSTGTHLHFQVSAPDGNVINPCKVLGC